MTDMNLVEFLNARLDELAEVAAQGWAFPRLEGEVAVSVLDEDGRLGVDAAWLLADIAAKRRIVELHSPGHDPCDAHDASMRSVPCDVLKLLALPYADHPDYREEWKP